MNCREFERVWNERLDGEGSPDPAVERELERHLAFCVPCRLTTARFEALARAIESWSLQEPLEAPAGLAEKVADRFERERSSKFARLRALRDQGALSRATAAAALVLTIGLAIVTRPGPVVRELDRDPNLGKPLDRSAFVKRSAEFDVLTELSGAAWSWARAASGPAARTGLRAWDSARPRFDFDMTDSPTIEILAVSTLRQAEPAAESDPNPRSNRSRPVNRLDDRVRPLSTSARRAFGFLLSAADPAS